MLGGYGREETPCLRKVEDREIHSLDVKELGEYGSKDSPTRGRAAKVE